jgi:hypothetical protein
LKTREVILPKRLSLNFITSIINNFNFIFHLENKKDGMCILRLDNIEKVDLVGIIILFKFIEYSVTKECFENPKIVGHKTGVIAHAIEFYGFKNLLKDYISEKDIEKSLLKLQVAEKDSFLVAPQALIRDRPKTKTDFDRKLEVELKKFYGSDASQLINTILQCSAEISSNFFNHAVEDTKSIILARGNKKFYEIVSADTGDGILNTLRQNEEYDSYSDSQLVLKSMDKEVTCKPNSNHMGFGLWLIKEVTRESDGILEILSGDVRITVKDGQIKRNDIPKWKGTIVYLKIPVEQNGISIANILRKNRQNLDLEININFA